MSPGTLNGRVASATPMGLDLSRLAPRLRSQPQPTGNDPASVSRLSADNFTVTALTAGSWHAIPFPNVEEQVGDDLTLNTSTGVITVNTDGIYSAAASIVMTSRPVDAWASLDIAVSGTLLPAYMRTGQVLSSPWLDSDRFKVEFPPYFLHAGSTIVVSAAAGYPSGGGPTAPDFVSVWVQRII